MICNYNLLWTEDEYKAIINYKGAGYNFVNILLSDHLTHRELAGKGFKSLNQFHKYLLQTMLVYKAIKKNHIVNNKKKQSNFVAFRGANNELGTSFLSSTPDLEMALEFSHYGDNSRIFAIDLENVSWISLDDLIYDEEDEFDEREILILPSKIEKSELITLKDCVNIARNNGKTISEEQETYILNNNKDLKCYSIRLSELECIKQNSNVPTLEKLDELFEQYLSSMETINHLFLSGKTLDSEKMNDLIDNVNQFKENVIIFLKQLFYEINQDIEYSFNKERNDIIISQNVDISEVFVGNTGQMFLVKDNDTLQEFYFKPALSKTGNQKIYRSYIQEAAYQLQLIINPDNAVRCNTINLNGAFGAIQDKIDIDVEATNNFFDYFENGNKPLPEKLLNQIFDEYLVDFCLCNYDSHFRNFVIDKDGKLRGIDKEQSFRYINEDTNIDMLFSVNYNECYGESSSIYNILFNKIKNGDISIDVLSKLNYRASRIAQYPDDQYIKIFEQYAYNKAKNDVEAKELLEKILLRKKNILKNVGELYQFFERYNQENNNDIFISNKSL